VWIKRRWLAFLVLPLTFLPICPRDVENILRVMNETKVEFTIPDEDDKGDGSWPPIEMEPAQQLVEREEAGDASGARGSEKASARSL
jgi:hypothetical protein